MTALYIVLIVISVIMLLILIPADLIVSISYNGSEMRNDILIKYAFLKFRIYPADKEEKELYSEAEKDEGKKKKQGSVKSVIGLVKAVYRELKDDILKLGGYFFKRALRIKELNISAKFGTGDPMYTGILSGTVNSVTYNAVSFIDRHMTLDKWNVALDADFDSACLSAGIYAKIRTRILYALRLGIMAVFLLLKIQKINRRIKKDG